LLADVDAAMQAIGRRVPIDLPGHDRVTLRRAVPVLDRQGITRHNHRDPMKGIAVPGSRLTGSEAQPADENAIAVVEDFVEHRRCPFASRPLDLQAPVQICWCLTASSSPCATLRLHSAEVGCQGRSIVSPIAGSWTGCK